MKRFLEKIDEWIAKNILLDDTLHFIAGMIVVFVIYMIALPYFGYEVDFHLISAIALMGTFLVGLGKEIADRFIKKTETGIRDVWATVIGGIVAIVFMEIFKSMNIFVDMYVRETIMNNFLN